jgi:hypothetical protein
MGTVVDELQVHYSCLPNETQNKISDSQWTAQTKNRDSELRD